MNKKNFLKIYLYFVFITALGFTTNMIENNFIAGFVMLFSFIAIPVIGFKLISSILKPTAKTKGETT